MEKWKFFKCCKILSEIDEDGDFILNREYKLPDDNLVVINESEDAYIIILENTAFVRLKAGTKNTDIPEYFRKKLAKDSNVILIYRILKEGRKIVGMYINGKYTKL